LKSYEISAIASAVVVIAGLAWYLYLVARRQINTVLASWVVSATALSLSLATYVTSPKANILGGTLNAASVLAVIATLAAVYVRSRVDGVKLEINPFQKKCLIASALITVLWIVIVGGMGGTGLVPNLLTQLLLVISYWMLIKKFWRAEKNTESTFTWWCVLISSIIGLYTAYRKADGLAMVYALRSTVMCGLLVFALHRIEYRNAVAQAA
jgi:hypothetical protein